jgi:hypothetical protein
MMAGTAITHLVSEHGLAEGEVTKAKFHFKKEPGAEYEEWYDEQLEEDECKHQVEDEVAYLSSHCLPKALPGSAAKVVKVEEEPEEENIVLEHKVADQLCVALSDAPFLRAIFASTARCASTRTVTCSTTAATACPRTSRWSRRRSSPTRWRASPTGPPLPRR